MCIKYQNILPLYFILSLIPLKKKCNKYLLFSTFPTSLYITLHARICLRVLGVFKGRNLPLFLRLTEIITNSQKAGGCQKCMWFQIAKITFKGDGPLRNQVLELLWSSRNKCLGSIVHTPGWGSLWMLLFFHL